MTQTTTSPTVAQHLVKQLQRWGCKRIYGVIGDATLYLLDAMGKQSDIAYIACRTETNAALMASAEAKLTGQMAVCIATSGPGIASLLNGLADAACDQAPVLVITGQVERTHLGTGTVQDINQQALIHPIARYSSLVADSHAFPKLLNIAMKMACEQGGVAHLSVPKDLWRLPVTGTPFPSPPTKHYPIPTETELEQICKRIDDAKRPVILAGRGIQHATGPALQLAEHLHAPLIATMPAKPYVPNDHELFVGGLGQAGSEIARELLEQADLCLILGATWWPSDYVPSTVPIIQIDADPQHIGRTHATVGAVAGNLAHLLPLLINQVAAKDHPSYAEEIAQKKQRWNQQLTTERTPSAQGLTPAHVFAALNEVIAPDAIMAVDTGDHTLWLERTFQFDRQELLLSGTWRTLGFGLPAGIAAQLAQPGRQVVSIAGDGGCYYSLPELNTAVTHQLPLTYLILNNQSYAMEQRRMEVEALTQVGAVVPNADFAGIARACGAEAHRVTQPSELTDTLVQALASPRTSVVEIFCDSPPLPHYKIITGIDETND